MNYDKSKYRIWNWKNPVVLHWIINPGLAFNELVLGQTIPKVMLIEKEGERPLFQRSLIPCPHCNTLHSGLKWTAKNKTAFKNWFGIYCDHCSGIIPVQRNLTSLLILLVTFPVWGWFRKLLKQKWLNKQPERYKNLNLEIPIKTNTTSNWLKLGLIFGLLMFVLMTILLPLIFQEAITRRNLLFGIPLWLICGLVWGYTMKLWMNKKGRIIEAPNKV
jgi:hypothetical protein